jgi:diacylglycerol O-acyltransferase
MALNVTVQSYNGRMDYGLIACRRVVPDINDLGDYLLAEHQALLARAQAEVQAAASAATPVAPTVATASPARPLRKAPAKRAAAPRRKLALVAAAPAPASRKRRAA